MPLRDNTPEYYVFSTVVSPALQADIDALYTSEDQAKGFSADDLAGDRIPPEDVLQVDIDRRQADFFETLRTGQATFVLDNGTGRYSPARNSLLIPDRYIGIKARLPKVSNPVSAVLDVTSRASPVTISGKPFWSRGAVGPSALSYSGLSTDFLTVDSPVFPTSGFTWEFLMQHVGETKISHPIWVGSGVNANGFGTENEAHISVNSNGTLNPFIRSNGANCVNFTTDDVIRFDDTRPVHVALTVEGPNIGDAVRLYADGVLVGSRAIANTSLDMAAHYNRMGLFGTVNSDSLSQDRRLRGSLEEVRIWDYARSQAEIQANMHESVSAVSSGLLHYFPMFGADPPGRTVAKDKSLNGQHLAVSSVFLAPGRRTDFAYRLSEDVTATVVVSAFQDISGTAPYTVMVRASPVHTPATTNGFIISNEGQNPRTGYSLSWRPSGGPNWRAERAIAGAFTGISAAGTPNLSQHVAMTYTGSFIGLYVEGVPVGSVADTRTLTGSASNLYIGDRPESGVGPFAGVISEAAVFDYALDADQVQEAVTSGPLLITGSPPIGYWDFDDGGTYFSMFSGKIDDIAAGVEFGRRTTVIRASDLLKEVTRNVNIPLDLETNVGSVARKLVDQDDLLRDMTNIDPIPDEVPFATFDEVPIGEAITAIIRSGFHSAHVDGSGFLNIKARGSRIGKISRLTVDNYALGMTFGLSDEKIINDARIVSINRRESLEIATVAFIDDPITLTTSQTIELLLEFRDPVTDERAVPCNSIAVPVASQDYYFASEDTGGGTDLTSNISLVFTPFARTALLSITNVGSIAGFLTRLQVRAFPVSLIPSFIAVETSSASIVKYGQHSSVVENELAIGFRHNETYAQFLIAQREEPVPEISISLRNEFPENIVLDITDDITVVESHTGVDSGYTITSVRHTITKVRGTEHTTRWGLDLTLPRNFLVLDADPEGRLDDDNVLGF